MAWGGPEEQQKEHGAGKSDAKDWYDEALKIVERTMEEYWNREHQATTNENDNMLESEFDCYCQDGRSWKAKLWHYISNLSTDVLRDKDIMQWWAMQSFTQPLPKLQRMFAPFPQPQYLMSASFQLVLK
ncbi:hypothetical protein PAXRUDRAFT_15306 [Paxillus rubicundulus Ve08.2h10]|uniref:Uncharacterized protein n=1 Tax=Paxillus rubicundulus Ve08.2h10 TaxID=930991 RepID=A0A0D0DB64_9AGAM|nr:hypothetical protein PAXRUDRAFT_15306 [Paxillus rubicundulus Ve08.2h10]